MRFLRSRIARAASLWLVASQGALLQYATSVEVLERYLENQVELIEENTHDQLELARADDWEKTKEDWRQELRYQLGLTPWPESTPLNASVRNQVARDGIVVEALVFESRPGLFVTANLYRPEVVEEPLPAILYVCGHAPVVVDGVIYGNKVAYQRHGAWFAKNGYVCLTLDTLQLGEIEGLHHGTYRHGRWDWNDRGYTPAGVEAWNGIRGLDYLQSRPEVDGNRLGVTGRSGGGATTWWVAALDERVRAAVPVAGITTLRNHVVDRCVEGHCDCMYFPNSHRWDFSRVAALVAPRPLLISNSDKDSIFPLDGVLDVYWATRRVYEQLDAMEGLGLNIEEGPHKDTQPLRVSAFQWFERFLRAADFTEDLKNAAAPIQFTAPELKALEGTPAGALNGRADETWLPPGQRKERQTLESMAQRLRQSSFQAWPLGLEPIDQKIVAESQTDSGKALEIEFVSEAPLTARLFVYIPKEGSEGLTLQILNQSDWESFSLRWAALNRGTQQLQTPHAWLAPRDVGPGRWELEPRRRTHVRRSLALLGSTIDSGKIYDAVCGIEALSALNDFDPNEPITVLGRGAAGFLGLFTSLYSERIDSIVWEGAQSPGKQNVHILNWRREASIDGLMAAISHRATIDLTASSPENTVEWQSLVRGLNESERAAITVR